VSKKTNRQCGAFGLGNRVDVSRLSRTEAGLQPDGPRLRCGL